MQYTFAPMEGLTDSIYRRLHCQYFGGVDAYYMPFFSPTVHRVLTPREQRELPEACSQPFRAVPQVLTKNAEDFLWAAQTCQDLGYDEINLNLGCPSGTVVSKGKGSGMLADPDSLKRFLDAVYGHSALPISLKTRLGIQSPEEFPQLVEIFNQYPVKVLIVHPRVRKAFYAGSVQLDSFRYAVENSKNPLMYNGNLCSLSEIEDFAKAFPTVNAVMLGRGLIGDPGMLVPGGTNKQALVPFFDALLNEYTAAFGSSRNAMFRLKENWYYLLCHFENAEKLGKKLRKTTDVAVYRSIVNEIFETLPMKELTPCW